MYKKIPPQSEWYDPINGLTVVSMFDGISCGLVALIRAGHKIARYVAFEIDEAAILVSQWNFNIIEHRGTVEGVDFTEFAGFDLLIGGSPCQGFSFAGKQLNFEDPRSALFFEFVRAKNEINPRNFLLENVRMKKQSLDTITQYLNVEPIYIDSALVSAQTRKRWYWSDIKHITQPENTGLLLKDIIVDGFVDRDKALAVTTRAIGGASKKRYLEKNMHQIVFGAAMRGRYDKTGKVSQILEVSDREKSNAITTVQKDSLLWNGKDWRTLTPVECERLQTLPDNYTADVNKGQRSKALGNGWTVDVIAHIFNFMHDDIL